MPIVLLVTRADGPRILPIGGELVFASFRVAESKLRADGSLTDENISAYRSEYSEENAVGV
ncbi:hypothetical protein BVI1335_1520018 [Burkholderia vietnamiensis]|nr:hypothetical protein BVI1335_1520018 [Burkholderia vietnamiensis]